MNKLKIKFVKWFIKNHIKIEWRNSPYRLHLVITIKLFNVIACTFDCDPMNGGVDFRQS